MWVKLWQLLILARLMHLCKFGNWNIFKVKKDLNTSIDTLVRCCMCSNSSMISSSFT
ncbi:hypothetical protein BT93_L2011 [Corymbia citriodora subsp. variegata]|uniref:Uncharacterized protein n=1 Tax=Corymbia citriodora subsp. variegata TaxID=360336 RepID=A0A8T0CW90_CORYI|nr:hypothetical protein BT93_L2011 [Corymbia citriodora subsp. variegata]